MNIRTSCLFRMNRRCLATMKGGLLVWLWVLTSAWGELVCDEPEYYFGEAAASDTISHTFTLRNDGDQTVRIRGVRTTCGCSTTGMTASKLAPGERSELTVNVDLRGRTGAQRFVVWVRTDDDAQPLLMLLLHGTVTPVADDAFRDMARPDGRLAKRSTVPKASDDAGDRVARPRVLTLDAHADAPQQHMVVVYSRSRTPFSIDEVSAPDGVEVSLRAGMPHRHIITLEGVVADADRLNTPLTIRTSTGETLTVPFVMQGISSGAFRFGNPLNDDSRVMTKTQHDIQSTFVSQEIEKEFTHNANYMLDLDMLTSIFAITGNIELHASDSLVRVILVDKASREYLIHQSYPLIVDSMEYDFEYMCEESCMLANVIPSHLKIQVYKASVSIREINGSFRKSVGELVETPAQLC